MFVPDEYALLDFGEGRKLERFGPFVLDRPSSAAEGTACSLPQPWHQAHARYERNLGDRGAWHPPDALPPGWTVRHGAVMLGLKPTPFGHLGVFPEQAQNWDWIAQRGRHHAVCKVLNLFAYTGGSTLAAAAAGAEVVHLDAADNIVKWARRNAELSGLADAPIRWITEDAARFVAREVRRRNTYDAVILDPPSYGHGPTGQVWKLADHLPGLLSGLAKLTGGRPWFLLLTCHNPEFGPVRLRQCVAQADFHLEDADVTTEDLLLTSDDGRALASGTMLRMIS